MNDDQVWYNIKEKDGEIVIEKKSKKKAVTHEEKETIVIPPKKKNKTGLFIGLAFLIIIVFVTTFLITGLSFSKKSAKIRTFIIYMVGSDLESNGKMATFDLNDLTKADINLDENNVVLMVGGSKKWHNFVDPEEIAIYELGDNGFAKIKTDKYTNMGSSSLLSGFLDYSYNNYPAEKYDLVFWNHGLGAAGLESDEVSEDYLSITELKTSLENSPFVDEKLETIIFNNCLSGNIHFANVVSNYADYMVASEEVMYVGALIDRLNFIEDVKESDSGYEVGLAYVNKTDESMKKLNNKSNKKYDSTLSIIDLSRIDKLDSSVNEFFESIDLKDNYRSIARARGKTYTYSASTGYSYDTVDLYELVEALAPYSNNEIAVNNLKDEIKNTVKYNSAINDYSNGISIYFPYFGTSEYIETHLLLFRSLWNNSYLKFIENFYDSNIGIRKARRASTESDINYLTNNVLVDDNTISIDLTDEELDLFQKANVYVFSKNNDAYNLLLKSNDYSLDGNKLTFNYDGVLTLNNNILSLYYDGSYKVYGSIDDNDVVETIEITDDNITIVDAVLDSKDAPLNGIVEYNDESKYSFYTFSYNLKENSEILEDWNESYDKEKIEYSTSLDLVFDKISLDDCFILVEMYDMNNDIFYSK